MRTLSSIFKKNIALIAMFLSLAGGCAKPLPQQDAGRLIVVPGAGGDGGWRNALVRGLHEGGYQPAVTVHGWGAPLPLFFLNLQTRGIHNAAEKALARRLTEVGGQDVDLIGHSAGCGVILGALGRCDPDLRVRRVILLAPSVSPGYSLSAALARVEQLHVFHSTRDTAWLKFRTGTFGTYDNVRTPAAGHLGFDVAGLDATLTTHLTQHPYDPTWAALGNHGGHFGPLSRPFARTILAPLLDGDASPSVEYNTNGETP